MWRPFSRKSHRSTATAARSRKRKPAPAPSFDPRVATIDRIGGTAVATLTVTALSTDQGVAMLMGLFDQVSHSGASGLVLDIQNLEYMDSMCLGCLVQALNCAVDDGGRIALVNIEGHVQNMLRLAQLDRRFPVCHDVPKALAMVERG